MITLLPRDERQAELTAYWLTNRELFKSIYRLVIGQEPPADRKSAQLIGDILAKEYDAQDPTRP